MNSEQVISELQYIADSPAQEHGGFHPNAVAAAKAGIEMIRELEEVIFSFQNEISRKDKIITGLESSQSKLANIGKLIVTQDNASTCDPVFLVQQTRTIMGIDSNYCDDFFWYDTEAGDRVADPKELDGIKDIFDNGGHLHPRYERVWYVNVYEFVQAFFTKESAEAYIKSNRHNLNEPRVYVGSAYRNYEWQLIREALASMAVRESRAK